jgi:dTDP-4-amino-4,6-dideoxygalactose transaminase
MKVPFLDLKTQHASIRNEIDAVIKQVIDNTAFAGGPFVAQFEKEFASFCQCDFAIGVGSGTDALWLSLLALEIGSHDEVITVPNTFIATAEAISFCGARPVFVDIDEKTYTMNPELIEAAITPRTKAIIPVHLYGQMADMDPIMEVARKHKLYVIEDACQAHGATYKGRAAGSMGDAGCFSFYPGKNLGACGEAGAVVTNNPDLDKKIRILRDHGQPQKYHHAAIGWNARMDGFQGAILTVKLKYLDQWTEARRRNAALYSKQFSTVDGIQIPAEADYAKHVYHIYPILVKNRDALIAYLEGQGVSCGIHYPVPVHLTEAYRFLSCKKGDFPESEKSAAHVLSLPMYPELTDNQMQYVVNSVIAFYA